MEILFRAALRKKALLHACDLDDAKKSGESHRQAPRQSCAQYREHSRKVVALRDHS
jgi:hypothetical protein